MIIVGSTALAWWGLTQRVNDLDLWLEEGDHYEDSDNVRADLGYFPKKIIDLVPTTKGYATPDALYTIKCSHLGWDIFWKKHVSDVLLLKANGARLLPELYRELVAFWKVKHGNKDFLSLNKDKEAFFTDAVTYVYDHDYLHELVAYPNAPMYTHCLKDGEQVLIDKDKFDAMPFEDKVRMFREEISVIAAERWLIPPKVCGKVSWYEAYRFALRKTVTALTKNWATEFIVLNIEHFTSPRWEYFSHLLQKLPEGERVMSNVDLTPFEEIGAIRGHSVDSTVYRLCEGDLYGLVDIEQIPYPDRGERSWNDASYQEEVRLRNAQLEEAYSKALGGYEHLEQEGGGEGGAEYCYGVFKLRGKIYRAEYSYYSYNGHEYAGIQSTLREVTPVQKTITVYE